MLLDRFGWPSFLIFGTALVASMLVGGLFISLCSRASNLALSTMMSSVGIWRNFTDLTRICKTPTIGMPILSQRDVCTFIWFVLMELSCFPEAGGLDSFLLRFWGVEGVKG